MAILDVIKMVKRTAFRTATAGRVILGTMQIKLIQALVYWVKDHPKRDLDVTADMWTSDVMIAILQHKEAELNFEKVWMWILSIPVSAKLMPDGMPGRSRS